MNAMALYTNPAHKRIARSTGYPLTLGDEASFAGLSIVLIHRATARERAALAFACLRSLHPDHAAMTFDAARGEDFAPADDAMVEAAVEYRRARDRQRPNQRTPKSEGRVL